MHCGGVGAFQLFQKFNEITEKSAVIPPVFCAVTVSIPDPASALKSSMMDSTIRPGLL
jgi:hypothetical protein